MAAQNIKNVENATKEQLKVTKSTVPMVKHT